MLRIDRVIERMKTEGLSQILVSDPKSIWYLTGVDVAPFERMFVLLVKDNGQKVLFLNKLFHVEQNAIEEVWFSDTDDYIGMLAEYIDRSKKLGIDKEWTARFLIPLIERCGGLDICLSSNIVDDCRAVKDAEEIEYMEQASLINDHVIEKAYSFIKKGMTEKQVASFIDSEYLKEGASGNSFTTIVSFGENAADPHHEPDDTVLEDGMCVLIDMGCVKNRYCSDMTRTFWYGERDEAFENIHAIVLEANERAEKAVRPGVILKDVDATARDYISDFGYSEQFNHRLGHFIGQTDHEMGDVSSISEIVAEPGMIFSIEPGIYLKGKYGIRIEDLVLVTENGCKVLNRVEKKLRYIAK